MKNFKLYSITLMVICVAFMACSFPLTGTVTLSFGNLMPSPDAPNPKAVELKTTIAFCEPAIFNSELTNNDGIYTTLPSKLIKETTSNEKGLYKISLTGGTYSVFVKIPQGWYAREVNDKYINAVVIEKGKKTIKNIDVKYNTTQ